MSKRGSLDISFGMIFSIILIITFVGLAIYVITIFLNTKNCAETGFFKDELQTEVDRAWNSDETSKTFNFNIPADIKEVCFFNVNSSQKGEFVQEYEDFKPYRLEKLNMYFYPIRNTCDGQRGYNIKHIDVNKMTIAKNPYCFENKNGKISVKIEGYYSKLVTIK